MTGTIAGFTSTGIDDNATSTAITIDASENVGVGGVSPTQRMQVDGGAVRVTGDQAALVSNQGLMLGFTGDKSNFYSIGSSGGGVGTYSFKGYNYTTGAGSERMSIDSAGNVTVNTGNLVIGTSGKGIDFSADGNAAGMTSEVLDDYEEGTWTPTLVTGTATVQDASYTKIGNIVTATFTLSNFSNMSSTAVVEIEGLPFAGKTARHVGSSMGRYTDVSANNLYMAASTKLHVYGNSSGAWVQLKHSDLNNSASQIYCSITYQT
jgi:hypothetical protein